MLKVLIALAAISAYPGEPQPEVWNRATTTAAVPRLIPGHPPRRLFQLSYQGQAVKVWGWQDTEGEIHWFPSENPHIQGPQTSLGMVGAVPNYGVNLKQSHSALNRVGAELKTNDPAFGAAFRGVGTAHQAHPGKPCPGPGPCPNPGPSPAPPQPIDPRVPVVNHDLMTVGAAGALGVGLVLYRRKRKGP